MPDNNDPNMISFVGGTVESSEGQEVSFVGFDLPSGWEVRVIREEDGPQNQGKGVQLFVKFASSVFNADEDMYELLKAMDDDLGNEDVSKAMTTHGSAIFPGLFKEYLMHVVGDTFQELDSIEQDGIERQAKLDE